MRIILIICLLLAPVCAQAEDDAIARIFAAEGVEGAMVISSVGSGQTLTHNGARATQRLAPASSFKVFNTLIALEEKVVTGKDSFFKWDGVRHDGFPDWNHDQTLSSAFKVSCVWCYQDIARKVGAEKYRRYIELANYGALANDFDVSTFWLENSLRISAVEQVAFLKKVYRRELPFSANSYDVLKDVMLAEQSGAHKLYGKTGWAIRVSPQIGWYVGYVETAGDAWVFATNITMRTNADLPLRQKLTKAALQAKGIIP